MLESNPLSLQKTDRVLKPRDSFLTSTLSTLRGVLVFVAVLGTATNFVLFLAHRDFDTPDSASYVDAANNLIHGRGFTDSAGNAEITRTPGYPLVIAPFLWAHLDLKYLIVLQHLLFILIALAASVFSYQLSGSVRQATITGILLCFDLPSLHAANTIMTEICFTATLMVVFWLLWNIANNKEFLWQRVALAGFLAGVSVLIRPISLYFFMPAAVYFILAGKTSKVRTILCFLVVFACLPFGWATRNRVRTGHLTLTAISGWNMLGYRAAGVLAVNDPGDFYLNVERRQLQLLQEVCGKKMGFNSANCLPLTVPQESIPQKSEAYMKLGRRIVAQHPVAYAKLAARGAALMMFGGDADLIMRITGAGSRSAKTLILFFTIPLFCLAIVGLYVFWTKERSFFYLACLVLGYFLVISAGAEAYSRMRVPIMPIYVILIAAGVDSVLLPLLRLKAFIR